MLRFFGAVLVCLAPVIAQAGGKRQFGNVVYELPKGWMTGRNDEENGWLYLLSNRDDDLCEFCTIRIHKGIAAKGSFKAWLRRRMEATLEDGVADKTMPPKVFQDKRFGEVHMLTRTVRDRGNEMQVFMAFKMEDRWEVLDFEADAGDVDELREAETVLKQDFLPMVYSVGFVSAGTKPVLGDPVPGDLHGVWFGSKTRYGLNLDATMRVDIDPVIYSFWPDGRFYEGVPETGLSAFDPEAALVDHTSEVGNYRIEGKKVLLDYADGESETLERDGEALEDGNAFLSKVRIAKDGFRFEGLLSNFSYMPFAPGISGGVASASDWEFFKDGTYVSSGFTGASGEMGSSAFTFSNPRGAKRGRYEISDGLIRLTPPEGDTVVWPFFLQTYDGKERPIVRGEYLKGDD